MANCNNTLEFVETYKRMCKAYSNCDNCPFEKVPCSTIMDVTDEQIKQVQQWSDAHPNQTRKTVFLKNYPNAKDSFFAFTKPCAIDRNYGCSYARINGVDRAYCIQCIKDYWNEPLESGE